MVSPKQNRVNELGIINHLNKYQLLEHANEF